MGRLLLLLISGAALGSLALVAGRPDLADARAPREGQSRALAREAADAAHAAALGVLVDPATGQFRVSLPVADTLRLGAGVGVVEGVALEAGGRVAVLTVTGHAGGVVHLVTSRYERTEPDFPGPVWLDAPFATGTVHPDATVDGSAPEGPARPVYFDAARYTAYRLSTALSLDVLRDDLGAQLAAAQGAGGLLSVEADMPAVLAATRTPTLPEITASATTAFDAARGDVLLPTAHVVAGDERYGTPGLAGSPPRIVRAPGGLTVPAGAVLEGTGLLLVEGDLRVAGTLRWDGLVLVSTTAQRVAVQLPGTVEVAGALLVDQEAPPPGGHTDLTVLRDLSGAWPTAVGTPGQHAWAHRHTHRIEATIPNRTFHFAEAASNRHEDATRFEGTLAAAGGPVYLRLLNPDNHGAAQIRLRLAGDDVRATAAAGFPAGTARPGDRFATRTFSPADLTDFSLEVRSLRLLARLVNREPSAVESWMMGWMPGGRCSDRPRCVGQLPDREGALTVQLVRAADDRPLYEAAVYWHTKEPGHPEFAQEQAADDAWRAAIAAGTTYGARLELGADVALRFSLERMAPIASRLGLPGGRLRHLGTVVRQTAA